MSTGYIDSHAHLFFNDFREDIDAVLERARNANVRAVIVPGTDLTTSTQALELAEQYQEIYAAVGFHPHDALKFSDADIQNLEALLSHPKVVAIGEIGLDFYYNYSPWDVQKRVFWLQLELAVQKELPVIIHTRNSMSDTIDLLTSFIEQNPSWRQGDTKCMQRGVFHCFAGTPNDAATVAEMGFYISFTGNVTFKKSTSAGVVQNLGAEMLLLETDAPYMTPVPHRGTRNEPAYLPLIAQRIAELCNVSVETVAEKTFTNTLRLFGLKL